METTQLIQIGWLIGATLVAIWGAALAKRRNRSAGKWFCICWLTGLIGLITLAVSKTLDCDEGTDFKETDTLGNIMSFVALAWLALNVYWGYMAAKAAHNAMWLDFMSSFGN